MSSNQFYGTIKPKAEFNAELAADSLEKAMKGFGCDKNKLIQVLTHINNAQRQMIRTPYKTKYGKDLVRELKRECSGDFEDVMVGLMETPTKYDVLQLNKAVKGLGTKEKILIEILCSRTNEELAAIRNEYQNEYGKTLEHDVIGDTSGALQRLLVSLVQGRRDESQYVDDLKANQDAHKLLADGEKKLGTDDSTFNSILVTQNFNQLKKVFVEYEKITGHGFEKAIEKEFSGDTKKGFLAIIQCIESKPKYFAKQLYDSMKGLGTRDNDLIRVIISRSEIDLALIREEFEVMYKKPLIDFIRSDCSGAYRDSLISIVKGN
ncbi:Annexin A7 [Toxocara canis]|uniref:Annexin n=1 Tax=Toxocara canis TaxID=6265 RepID=A0A0B2VJK1_TOXCA|nr:Annexin A7 [Toxocara canis]